MVFSALARTILLGGSLLTLAACNSLTTPGWIPNGYRFQDDTPLSSPAPSRPWVEGAVIHDTEKLVTNTAAWQGAVFELVEKISPSLPMDGSPLYLRAPAVQSPQNQALDHYLRQALLQKGFTLTTTPGFGPTLQSSADSLTKPNILKLPKREDGFEPIWGTNLEDFYRLSLTVFKGGTGKAVLGKTSVVAALPFEKKESWRFPSISSQSVSGPTDSSQKFYERQ